MFSALVLAASSGAQVISGKVKPIQTWCTAWGGGFDSPQQACDYLGFGTRTLTYIPDDTRPAYFPGGACRDLSAPPYNPYQQFTQKPKYCPLPGYQVKEFVSGVPWAGCVQGWTDSFSGTDAMYCQRVGVDPNKNKGPCDSTGASVGVGNPIHTGIFNKFEVEVDFAIGSGSMSMVFARTYNSAGAPTGLETDGVPVPTYFGRRWASTLDRKLIHYDYGADGTVWAVRPDGKIYFFNRVGSAWLPDPDVIDRLTVVVDGAGVQTGWKYVSGRDEEVETYDVNGRLTSLSNRAGYRLDLHYVAERLSSVTDVFGHAIDVTFGTNGLVASMTDASGNVFGYVYDDQNNLTEVNGPGPTTRRYHYENATFKNALTGITDELGARYATYTYDSYGSAVVTALAGGVNRWSIATVAGPKLRVTDPRGYTSDRTFIELHGVTKLASATQPCASCGVSGAASAMTYDVNGNLASSTDFRDKKTCYAYDTTRNLETSRLEGASSAEVCSAVLASPPNRPDVRKVTTTWHATWRLPATIVEPAPGGTKTTAFTYDASGNLTQKRITAPKNDGTATTITRTWKWTYGTFGRVLTATDPNNKVTTTTYHSDTDPDLGKRGQIATLTNPLGHVTQYTSYDAGNRLVSMTDPNGLVTTMTYDARGRLTSRDVGGELTVYAYDLAGQLTGVEMPDGATLFYVYDAAHRLTEVHDGLGNKVVYTLDGMGNRTAEQAFDPAGSLARTRTRVYDSLNRLAQEVGAQSQATVMTYDGNGNRLTSTDPLNNATTSTYDALNRLLTVTDPGNGVTQYAYDTSSNLTSVTDPRNLVTTYGYDGLGNQVSQVSPDTGTTVRTFDNAGNLKTSTDARGAKATYTYDAAGRVTKIAHTQTGFTTETHTYTWDGGTTGAPNAKGRITKLVDPSGTTNWTYTTQGRVASRSQVSGSVTLTQTYTWTDGRLTGITTPSGQQIGYAWDNGRITGVTLNGSPLISAGAYEPFGPVAAWQWGNGHMTYRDHDADGRLASWEYRNGTSILRRDLTWDDGNRITAIGDPADAANSHAYGYDNLDRLTTAQSGAAVPTTRQYAYDAIGNRQNATVDGALTNYGYATGSNQLLNLTGATSRSYTYDAAGNPTQIDGRTATYNLANRLTKLADGATTVASYKLNGLGQRVAKTIGSTTTRYFYDDEGRLVGEYAKNGALIQETIWLDDLPVATLRPTGSGSPTPVAVYYVHADQLATPRAVTRPSDDAIVWRWDHADPFGANPANENPGGLGTFSYNLRFPGQQYDAENGTHYNYFRDYDPAIGRLTESDPIGLNGGINTYGYVGANPVARSDPDGRQVVLPPPPIVAPISPPPIPGLPGTPPPGFHIPEFPIPSPGELCMISPALCAMTIIVRNACAPDNFCHDRWEREDGKCSKWTGFGYRWVQACRDRAAYRRGLCIRNGGKPDPDEPPEWTPDRG